MSFFSKLKGWFAGSKKPGPLKGSQDVPEVLPKEPADQPASILDLFQDHFPTAPTPQPKAAQDYGPVDVIICVHNALEDVKKCLHSVIEKTHYNYRIILVNDGSDAETTDFLRRFSKTHRHCDLLENKNPLRYTFAANQGMRHSVAPIVIMLNSDTVVPEKWMTYLMEALHSGAKVGMAGPLSNAASWQSVPRIFDSSGDWAVNYLPQGYDVDKFSKLIHRISEKNFPKVDFLNGFCLAIKREVIKKIGYFDEVVFPKGYGEENDYCLRARAAGFELAIADHAFVYHSKSRSYQHGQRQKLSLDSSIGLIKKHGAGRVKAGLDSTRHHPALVQIRMRIEKALENL